MIFSETLISKIRINSNDGEFNNFLRICRTQLGRTAPRKKKVHPW